MLLSPLELLRLLEPGLIQTRCLWHRHQMTKLVILIIGLDNQDGADNQDAAL